LDALREIARRKANYIKNEAEGVDLDAVIDKQD
jgi:hypothetical protein